MTSTLLNTERRYGAIAVLLHWLMAGLLLALLGLGLYMARLPDVGFDTAKITLVLLHKSLGMLAFMLALVRIAWRSTSVLPSLAQGTPRWQQVAARLVHLCMYGLMVALPLTGWLMSSAGGFPVNLFVHQGALPDLIPVNPFRFELLLALHRWLAWALAALVTLHASAAVAHHLLWKDDTLRKMLPGA